MFTITGKTVEGQLVLAGVYKFYETHGLPLDVIFDLLQARNSIPDWSAFHSEALKAGMKHDRIISKLAEAISDSFGAAYRDEVVRRLNEQGI